MQNHGTHGNERRTRTQSVFLDLAVLSVVFRDLRGEVGGAACGLWRAGWVAAMQNHGTHGNERRTRTQSVFLDLAVLSVVFRDLRGGAFGVVEDLWRAGRLT